LRKYVSFDKKLRNKIPAAHKPDLKAAQVIQEGLRLTFYWQFPIHFNCITAKQGDEKKQQRQGKHELDL
jgi:hypothetical protein